MITLKLKCTKKYFLDDTRGWKVRLEVPDGINFEAQGSFVLVSKDTIITNLAEGDFLEISIGS